MGANKVINGKINIEPPRNTPILMVCLNVIKLFVLCQFCPLMEFVIILKH